MDSDLNLFPRMEPRALIGGYRTILETIYSPKKLLSAGDQAAQGIPPLHLGNFTSSRAVGALSNRSCFWVF